jgi:hypothetical protein
MWIKPNPSWFTALDETPLRELVKQARLLWNNLRVNAYFLLFDQPGFQVSQFEFWNKLPSNYSVPSIFGAVSTKVPQPANRYVSRFDNGGVLGYKNNMIYKTLKNTLKNGYLLFTIGGNSSELVKARFTFKTSSLRAPDNIRGM